MRGSDCQTPQVNSTACLRKVVTIKAPSVSSCVMMLYSTFLFLSSNTITRLLSQFPNGTCLVHQCSSNKAGHKYTPNPQMSTSYLRIADISGELVNIFYTPTKSKLPTIYTITSKFVDVTWKQVFREFWGKNKLELMKSLVEKKGKKKKKDLYGRLISFSRKRVLHLLYSLSPHGHKGVHRDTSCPLSPWCTEQRCFPVEWAATDL